MDGSVQRPKYWKELTDTEKIERCREEIKNLQSRFRRDMTKAEKIIEALLEHNHLASGEVCKKISRYDYSNVNDTCEKTLGGAIIGEVYF